uniref:Tripartite motif-containing 68 n=1 Tax=Nannospalax galili TaxID=1026970 RepID=A0A8C6R4E9_NANGA
MDLAALMGAIVEEVNCPICMTFLRKPVSIDCGHTFCHSCLSGLWDVLRQSQNCSYTCPLCRAPVKPRNLRPTWQLANIVDKVRLLGLCTEMGLQADMCVLHKEQLKMFCKEDGVMACKVCCQCPEHEAHSVVPIDVAWEYKWKLHEALEYLRKEQEEAWKLQVSEKERAANWKIQVETRKHNIIKEYKKYQQLLKEEELPGQQVEAEAAAALASLEQEEEVTKSKLELSHEKLIQQSQVLWRMIAELEERSQKPVHWMLQEQILEPTAARPCLLGAEDRLPCAGAKRDPEVICSRCSPGSRYSLLPPHCVKRQKKRALWRHSAEPA